MTLRRPSLPLLTALLAATPVLPAQPKDPLPLVDTTQKRGVPVRLPATEGATEHKVWQVRAVLHDADKIPAEVERHAKAQIERIVAKRRLMTPIPTPLDAEAEVSFERPSIPELLIAGMESQNRETNTGKQQAQLLAQPLALPALKLLQNTGLRSVAPSGYVSQVSEPSVAEAGNVVMYTGNWFAAVSIDGGATFRYLDPFGMFPSSHGGFCCDQVLTYDSRTGMFFWYLQYVNDSTGNVGRLAYTKNPGGTWNYIDLAPTYSGSPWSSSHWFDYPHMVTTNKHVVITSNVFPQGNTGVAGSQAMRVSLDAVNAGQSNITAERFSTTDVNFYCPAQNATTTAYFAGHVSNSTLRVFSWPENGSVSSTDVAHKAYNPWDYTNATKYICTDPSGANACARMDDRLLASWVVNGQLGFMWVSGQGQTGYGSMPNPFVPVLVVNESTKAVISDTAKWSSSNAFVLPSISVNANGVLGGTIGFSGGTLRPSWGAYLGQADATGLTMNLTTISNGSASVPTSSERWGDYFWTRRSGSDGNNFVATGFAYNNGTGGSDPRFIRFGPDTVTGPSITTQPSNQTVNVGQTATFSVTASGTSLTYQWNRNSAPIAGATSATYTTPATVLGDSGSTFNVVVSNGSGSTTSNNATLTVNSGLPAAPSSLVAAPASSSQINLTWADNSNNETGFKLERKTGAAGTYAQIAAPAAGATSYANSGLAAGTTYYYRVRATNAAGDSAYSNEVNATTPTIGNTIACGETKAGSLGAGDPFSTVRTTSYADAYTFAGTAGQQVTLTMNKNGGSLDSWLVLKSPTGAILAQNDDGNGGTDSKITFTLTSTGTHTVEATSYYPSTNASGAGAYNLAMGCTIIGQELVTNGGFESGTANWTFASNSSVTTGSPQAGSFKAQQLGLGTLASTSIYQPILNFNGTAKTLRFYLKMTSAEGTTRAYDYLRVKIKNTAGVDVTTLATISNMNKSTYAGWTLVTASIPATAAVSNYRLSFDASEDSTIATTFFIDGVSIQ